MSAAMITGMRFFSMSLPAHIHRHTGSQTHTDSRIHSLRSLHIHLPALRHHMGFRHTRCTDCSPTWSRYRDPRCTAWSSILNCSKKVLDDVSASRARQCPERKPAQAARLITQSRLDELVSMPANTADVRYRTQCTRFIQCCGSSRAAEWMTKAEDGPLLSQAWTSPAMAEAPSLLHRFRSTAEACESCHGLLVICMMREMFWTFKALLDRLQAARNMS